MRVHRLAFCLVFAIAPLPAAQFQFSTLIRWGAIAGAGNWEVAVGNSPGSWAATDNATPHFQASPDRLFQVDYTRATGTATVRLYAGAGLSNSFDSASFTPAGGGTAALPTATWTLPALSFFVQAAPEPSLTQVSVSNLQLVTGTLNSLSPLQTTAMTAGQFLGIGAGTVNHNGDVSFVGDASGNWRLQGILSMDGFGLTSTTALTFGLSASATDVAPVPEPMTSVLIGLGLVGVALRKRIRVPGAAA